MLSALDNGGMALLEGTEYDPRNGAHMNASLADYLVPVNADVPAHEVHCRASRSQPQRAGCARGRRDRLAWDDPMALHIASQGFSRFELAKSLATMAGSAPISPQATATI
jgi:hypothetical protein